MREKVFHKARASGLMLSHLFTAFRKSFPLFRRFTGKLLVDDSGKETDKKVFQTLMAFSTSFPQQHVAFKANINKTFR
jgi:hypothetical protein